MMESVKGIPLLEALPGKTLDSRIRQGEIMIKTFRKGQLLHTEGERCRALEVILSGRVVVERITREGNLMTIAAFQRGDCIGGNLLFSSDPVYHLAVTAKQTSQVMVIPRETLFDLMQENPGFLTRYLQEVADNAQVLEGKLRYVVNLSIRQRVLNFLNAEQRRQGSRRVILPSSKTALAAQLGVQRSSLSRELQRMREEGLILFDRHSITLL